MTGLDLVLFGASGFVGRLVAEHLAAHAPPDLAVGLAGRSTERLTAVREALGPAAASWPLVRADALDADEMDELARRTRVVATTVGPYLRYGRALAEACARAGTHYADLTGEVLFVRALADTSHDVAVASGARLVPSCGFDSVPSDLGVWVLAERARADGAGELAEVTLVVRSAKGGISGGTIDSMRVITEEVTGDRSRLGVLRDPYALSPDRDAEPAQVQPSDTPLPRYDGDLGMWTGPFAMASHNSRIVRRSNALLGWRYGRTLRYGEVVGFGSSPLSPVVAAGTTAGLGALAGGFAFRPTRALLDRVLPSPGEGPDERTRREGRFRMDLHARTTAGARYRAVVAAHGGPGYQATSVMFGQSALALALDDLERAPLPGGVLTPATALGDLLVDRLRAQGFRLDVDER